MKIALSLMLLLMTLKMKSISFTNIFNYIYFSLFFFRTTNWCHNFIISCARIIFHNICNALIIANCNDLIRAIGMTKNIVRYFHFKG